MAGHVETRLQSMEDVTALIDTPKPNPGDALVG
jgi:hypothetical protein